MGKKVKIRATPAEEREFILTVLDKECKELQASAKACASKAGGFDYEQAARLWVQAEEVGDVIITIENLDEDWS